MKDPIKVCVTGAAGQIGYSLVPFIASGLMFGDDQPLIISLLEIEIAKVALDGFIMELHDSAYPLVKEFIPTTDPKVAFKDIDFGLFVGAFPRLKGMTRADLLGRNASIFKDQGKIIDEVAKKTAKFAVVGNPANTNCMILSHFAPSIPKTNFSCMTRLDLNRAKAQIALKIGVLPSSVKNNISFGNHSATQVPYVDAGYIQYEDKQVNIREAVKDDAWLDEDFTKCVKTRGGAVIQKRGKSSATSAARALCDHVRNWVLGTPEGEHVSMGVYSNGNTYGIADGIFYSFPVECKNGEYKIVKDVKLTEKCIKEMKVSEEELLNEQKTALELLEKKE